MPEFMIQSTKRRKGFRETQEMKADIFKLKSFKNRRNQVREE